MTKEADGFGFETDEMSRPATIDLEVTVRNRGTYAGYELFLSNYFEPGFRPFVYLKGDRRA